MSEGLTEDQFWEHLRSGTMRIKHNEGTYVSIPITNEPYAYIPFIHFSHESDAKKSMSVRTETVASLYGVRLINGFSKALTP